MDINGLHSLIGYLREDFKSFKNNDFHNLQDKVEGVEKKVDKLGLKVAWIVGIISGLTLLANVLLRVL